MSLHHKVCHVLGGSFNLPHSETHAIVLPHVLAYNAPKTLSVMHALSQTCPESHGDALRGLNALVRQLNIPHGLKSLRFKDEGIDKAADLVVRNSYANRREVERALLREVIRRAWAGENAKADLLNESSRHLVV